MNHIGGGKGLLGGYRNYKYNGKELQETGMYDYGARFYMPDIGRWAVVDPRSQYTHETYSYVWNNSILFNDPTGMEGETGKCPPNCPNGVSAINISPNGQKETTIQEIILTGKAADNSSGPGSLAMAALIVSQADSPAPGPADIVAAGMLIGAGVWWTYNQFAPPSTGYTTIADPGAGYRNLKTEDTAEEDKDANGVKVPQEDGRTSEDPLRRDKHGHAEEDPEAKGTHHTQLGMKDGRKGRYRQGREFKDGQPEWDYDMTDTDVL